ncbi:MAG: helix-turn-helix domain-containing protein, partial [Alphaproteobacteria bacterium]
LPARVPELRLPAWGRGAPGDLILGLWGALDLPGRPSPDPRIVTLLRALEDDPDAFSSFSEAADRIGLRPSRARELIREAVGVPFRRYRLWRRMACAGRELAKSRSLTEAAYAAGFASSAHFSTAFRLMFGLPPSALLKAGVQFDIDGAPRPGA